MSSVRDILTPLLFAANHNFDDSLVAVVYIKVLLLQRTSMSITSYFMKI